MMNELASEKVGSKDTRKNSVMLPNGNEIIDSSSKGGSSLAVGGMNIVGGIDNYKRYQMLVKQSMGPNGSSSSTAGDKTYKRSQSLLGESKSSKFGPSKRTGTLNDNNNERKKTTKIS